MAMLRVSCPHCGTPTRIDSARLPEHAVRLPCPSCQGELVLDKTKLEGAQSPPSVETAAARGAESERAGRKTPSSSSRATPLAPAADLPPLAASSSPAPSATPSPATPAAPAPVRSPAFDGSGPAGSGVGLLPPDFAIAEGTRLPRGIMVGDDVAAMAKLRDSLQSVGATLEVLAGAEVVRQLDSVPALQVIVAGEAGAPPCAAVTPFVDLPVRARRHTFVVLVASDVQTLDGNQAFLHEVDLVLNKKDLDRAAELVVAAFEFRNRLYAPLLEAEETAG